MSSLSEAKKALQFNREFVQLVAILKGIAASQFQTLARQRKKFEAFINSFEGFFQIMDLADTPSPFVRSQSDVTGVVMVTSDEGFMGGLNAKVITKALEAVGSGPRELIVIGGRGADTLKDLKLACKVFPGVIYEKRYEAAIEIKDFIVDQVVKGKFGKVIVTYPRPISLMVQKPAVIGLLPCTELFEKRPQLLSDPERLFVESQTEGIIQYLVGTWITHRLFDIFEESKLAELAARTTHLEQSHDRLVEQGKVLRHRYFRCRRELIDKGMRETFAAILLRRNHLA